MSGLTPDPAYARLIQDPNAAAVHRALTRQVLADHRRHRNVRACTGCAWEPSPVGRTGDPAAMGRRSLQFNAHLADLIVAAIHGPTVLAPAVVGSLHATGPASLTRTPATEADPPPGERPAAH